MTSLELSELLGNYGEFVGAIAVVATLVYLSIQVRANTKSTRSRALLDSSIQYQNLLLTPAHSAELRAAIQKNHVGEALDAGERACLAAWYNAQMNFIEATWIQAEMGAFGRGAEFEGLKAVLIQFLETPNLHPFVESDDHPHAQKAELKRHYGRLLDAAKSFSEPR
jgi:hypothetical protein